MYNIIALGADIKNSFFSTFNGRYFLSQPLPELGDADTLVMFESSVISHINDSGVNPDYIVCDLHPDYFSSRFARRLQEAYGRARLITVQHHFAHIASCMFDNNIDEKVIGISFDGTGYGSDGISWGGEFLICAKNDFQRLSHLRYVAQPGGDIASRQAWRMAVSYLLQAYGSEFEGLRELSFFRRIREPDIAVVRRMIEGGFNSPLTSSAGRLFDAVSSLIGVCDVSSFEAEAAILLERSAADGIESCYSYEITPYEISLSGMFRGIVEDLKRGVEAGIISSKFHNTLGEAIFDMSLKIADASGIDKVVISGGCFQNRYLVNFLDRKFSTSRLRLFKHRRFSTTDLGIAVGQAAVAAGLKNAMENDICAGAYRAG